MTAGRTIESRQQQLDALYADLFGTNSATRTEHPADQTPGNGHDLDDDALVARAKRAKNGDAFRRLWAGDATGYSSPSEADLALCSHLSFWTAGDAARIDRLFRQSGLCRSKWTEREDYRAATIARVLNSARYGEHDDGTQQQSETPTAEQTPQSLDNVVAVFRRWLHLPDLTALYAVLAAVVANLMPGDVVWLLLIGPSGSGKTELLMALAGLAYVYVVGVLTEAALLSGVSKKDKTAGSKGGLLREIGEFGIIVWKDLTSLLSMNRDRLVAVLAALREIADGSWARDVGTDGGQRLTWTGKVGLIAGVTPIIDRFHNVIGAMGERFVYLRLPVVEAEEQSRRALKHVGTEAQMRRELAEVVSGFFAGLTIPVKPIALTEDETRRLVALATLAVRCRSAVERDPHTRDIELVPESEAPARLARALARLLAGMRVIGVSDDERWRVLTKIALDSMSQLRRQVLELLVTNEGKSPTTTAIAEGIGYPTQTTRRACEDLTVHGIVARHPGGAGKADCWTLTEWARRRYAESTGAVAAQTSSAAVEEEAGWA
ncbi:MAG: hypothetical protein ABSA52_21095 [Candidatus Binatia bacterium]|jgi:energy-coupling factor transporter ATP-binding protein EcfA2